MPRRISQFCSITMPIDTLTEDAAVLVAVLPRQRDLLIAREQHWYRIPLAHAPRNVAAEALAFYQTAAFGTERWAVRYIATVAQIAIATRGELLPDEAMHPRAHDRYLCFRLDAVETLPIPVPSRRLRRIVFIPTTFGQLLRARDVTELWHPEEHQRWGYDIWAAGLAGKSIR